MERIQHDLIQGSDEWAAFRLEHDGASEVSAALGLSKKSTRAELMFSKHSGLPKVFSQYVQEKIIDQGHEVEALARPLVEEIIGESLYPVTYSYGRLSASCDGLTASDQIAFEHKAWNAPYAAMVKSGEVPPEHMPQCQQVMYVTGAEKLIFVMSDGTPENLVYVWVLPDPEWVKRIEAGWKQFHEDLANYQPIERAPAAVATPIIDLPAIIVTVDGALSIETNFATWGIELKNFISRIPEKPSTDQEFADCKSAVAALKKAEAQLDAEESRVLSLVPSIDDMKREKKFLRDLSSTTRLALEKLVTARDNTLKLEIIQSGKDELAEHVATLNIRLGKPFMPDISADWATAIKGKKLYSAMRSAVSDLVAAKKIESNAIADKIQINLATLDEAKEYGFLFSDRAALVMKESDDLALIIRSRIADHKSAEEKRLTEEREKMRLEEEAKAEAKIKAEQAESQRKAAAEAAAKIEADRKESAAQPVQTPAPLAQPEPAVAAASHPNGKTRMLERLGELAQQMTERELSDLCIHAQHIIFNRKEAA